MMMAQGLSHGLHLNRRIWKRDASGLRTKIAQGDADMVTYIGQPQVARSRFALLPCEYVGEHLPIISNKLPTSKYIYCSGST